MIKRKGVGRPKKTIKQKKNATRLVKKFKKEPSNYIFWKGMLKDNLVQQFIDRGSAEQKLTIKKALLFLKLEDCEMFDEVNGKNLLKQLNRKVK